MSEAVTVPALRFPEFEGDWEDSKLGGTVSLQSGFAFASEQFGETGTKLVTPKNFTKSGAGSFTASNTKYTTEQVDEKFLCSEGDLLALLTDLTPSCELLGKPLELTAADGEVLLNQRIVRIDPLEGKIQKGFLKAFMLRNDFHVRMFTTASGTTVRHSSNKVLRETPINIPSLPEQKKIAAFFGGVDAKLTALRDRVALLERYKRGLMQALFSQSLRFTKPDGTAFPDWEEKTILELAWVNPKSPILPEVFKYIDLESVKNGILGDASTIDVHDAPSRAQRFLNRGDILYQTVRPYQRNNLFFDLAGDYVASTGYAQLRAKENKSFLFQLIHTDFFVNSVLERCTGTSYPAINSNDLAKISVRVPHPDEQQKIADALSAMDAKIAAVSDQVAQMEQFKKGLLQQMFV